MTDIVRELCADELDTVSGGFDFSYLALYVLQTAGEASILQQATQVVVGLSSAGACPAGMSCT